MKTRWNWLKSMFRKPRTYLKYREYPLFAELGNYDLYLLDGRMHERIFKVGEVIFETGFPLEVIYFINSGKVQIQGMYFSDKEKTISNPNFLGLLDMYQGEKRSSTAIAKTEVVMHAIAKCDLIDFIKARPHCGVKILHAACKDFSDFIFEKVQED